MKKLAILIAALLLLGLSASSALAKPPRLMTLIGGPLADGATKPWKCDIHNHSTDDIDVVIEICVHTRNNVSPATCAGANADFTLLAERFFGLTLASGTTESGICRVSYIGQPGDILGTLCGSNGCVQLQ